MSAILDDCGVALLEQLCALGHDMPELPDEPLADMDRLTVEQAAKNYRVLHEAVCELARHVEGQKAFAPVSVDALHAKGVERAVMMAAMEALTLHAADAERTTFCREFNKRLQAMESGVAA
jgi:hypothetical protein